MEYAQYLTEESSKPPEQQQYIQLRFTKPRERKPPGDGKVNQHNSPNETGTLTRKTISKAKGDETQNPRSNLNKTEPNCR